MRHLLLCLMLILPGISIADLQQREFSSCISDWQLQARDLGLQSRTIEEVIPSLKHLPEVIGYDRAQPEFTQTFAQYLYRRVTPARIDLGEALLEENHEFLAALTRQFGIPGRYLVAFWGMESNYGAYLGKMPTLNSLATLACDPRRSEFFTEELFAALKLMERESFKPRQMRGSWAGAMGHTQFMPSAYRQYAIDGNDDNRIDLWQSHHDALASGANFLQHLGWQRELRWGREVSLPEGFPFHETGLDNRKPLHYWVALGVTASDGKPLPASTLSTAILLPAGHSGPAFAVYPNFDVIMKWNRSEFYALAVGLLADQISGHATLRRPPSLQEKPISRESLIQIQTRLNLQGFDAGEPDGIMGPRTRSALRAFQASAGLIADGYPDQHTRSKLLADNSSSRPATGH